MTPLIDFAIGLCLLLVFSLWFGVPWSVWWLATPLVALLVTAASP